MKIVFLFKKGTVLVSLLVEPFNCVKSSYIKDSKVMLVYCVAGFISMSRQRNLIKTLLFGSSDCIRLRNSHQKLMGGTDGQAQLWLTVSPVKKRRPFTKSSMFPLDLFTSTMRLSDKINYCWIQTRAIKDVVTSITARWGKSLMTNLLRERSNQIPGFIF